MIILSGSVLIIVAYCCHFYYWQARQALNVFDGDIGPRLMSAESRLARLEAHKPKRSIPTMVKGVLFITDTPISPSSVTLDTQQFEIVEKSNGFWVTPEIRVPVALTNICRMRIRIPPKIGSVSDAWVSRTEPFADIASFEKLDVFREETNSVVLTVIAKPGRSFKTELEMIILKDSD